MRIIAGIYGGRQLISPKTKATRPMTDKVRAALFDILGPLGGLSVLDAYAGSGALGFEALSRGAARVVAVESARPAITAIQANVRSLQLEWGYSLEPVKVEAWLARPGEQRFDLIFAMPPYAILDAELLSRLGAYLASDGTMVIEYPRQVGDYELPRLREVDRRSYGDPSLCFYKPA